MKRVFVIMSTVLLFTACGETTKKTKNSVLNEVYTEETLEQHGEALNQELDSADLMLLTGYILSFDFTGNQDEIEGKTFGQILDEAKKNKEKMLKERQQASE